MGKHLVNASDICNNHVKVRYVSLKQTYFSNDYRYTTILDSHPQMKRHVTLNETPTTLLLASNLAHTP